MKGLVFWICTFSVTSIAVGIIADREKTAVANRVTTELESKPPQVPSKDVLPEDAKMEKTKAPTKRSRDWTKPPDFSRPKVDLWQLSGQEICHLEKDICKPLPSDNTYCISVFELSDILTIGDSFMEYAERSCTKWGEDWLVLAVQKKKFKSERIHRPYDVEAFAERLVRFPSKHTHVSWIYEGSVSASPGETVLCYSDKQRDKFIDHYSVVLRRCKHWSF